VLPGSLSIGNTASVDWEGDKRERNEKKIEGKKKKREGERERERENDQWAIRKMGAKVTWNSRDLGIPSGGCGPDTEARTSHVC
jgi:hypothetical protein